MAHRHLPDPLLAAHLQLDNSMLHFAMLQVHHSAGCLFSKVLGVSGTEQDLTIHLDKFRCVPDTHNLWFDMQAAQLVHCVMSRVTKLVLLKQMHL